MINRQLFNGAVLIAAKMFTIYVVLLFYFPRLSSGAAAILAVLIIWFYMLAKEYIHDNN